MSTKRFSRDRGTFLAVAVPILIILVPLGYSFVSSAVAQRTEAAEPFFEAADADAGHCVRWDPDDPSYMRYHHMDLLKEIRIDAVRDGFRGEVKFDKCWECHTSREKFCDRCHDAVNLEPDCFGCHYYPK